MKFKLFFKYWGPVFVWCAIIFILSSFPTLPSPKIIWWDFVLKKSAHLTEYAILYFLVFRAVNKISNIKYQISKSVKGINWNLPFIFSIPYSISDEIHQYFIPGRHCRWYDIAIDFLGMLIAFWLIKKNYLKSK